MGLDIVELVMNIEETFGVVLPDEEAARLKTLGETHRWLLRQVGRQAAGPCLSGATFYRVRRALVEIGVPRHAVRPRTEVNDLLPAENRRVLWRRFGQALRPLRPPQYIPGYWLFVSLAAMLLNFFGTVAFFLAGRPYVAAIFGTLVLTVLQLARWLFRVSAPLALSLPHSGTTVGNVVHGVLRHNYAAISDAVLPAQVVVSPEKEREVWDTLCRLVGEWSGVDPKRLTESTRWSDELGGS
jgi:hypothetical protein